MDKQYKKCLQRQTLPTIPLEPKGVGGWNMVLILCVCVLVYVLSLQVRAYTTIQEHITKEDKKLMSNFLSQLDSRRY